VPRIYLEQSGVSGYEKGGESGRAKWWPGGAGRARRFGGRQRGWPERRLRRGGRWRRRPPGPGSSSSLSPLTSPSPPARFDDMVSGDIPRGAIGNGPTAGKGAPEVRGRLSFDRVVWLSHDERQS
jgi:hypothetical protein